MLGNGGAELHGNEVEGIYMARTEQSKMSPIERSKLGFVESFHSARSAVSRAVHALTAVLKSAKLADTVLFREGLKRCR